MKKITLFFAVALIAAAGFAQQVTLSQSIDTSEFVGAVACGGGGFTADNVFYRAYTPSDEGEFNSFSVEGVDFAFNFTAGTVEEVEVTVRAWTTDAAFPGGALTEVAMATAILGSADDATIVSVDFETPYVSADAGDQVVISLEIPDADDTFDARIGMNDLGETGEGYISSVACAIASPTTYTAIGFPDAHIIFDLRGSDVLGTENSELAQVSIFPNPASDLLNINVPSTIEVTSVALYDVLGKATNVSLSNGQINISGLARGIYILNVNTTAGTLTEKVIIE
ncbi:MAG: hypothetical protein ACI825_001127 [Planctomycetota bacterium]|jgi:hypothetical protein|uniref:T9SS type A sorting domain-containing protein n=1 Tax=Patiriisocius sp. Uisw_047 TaxID=3230969 RepID=UPI0039EA0AC2